MKLPIILVLISCFILESCERAIAKTAVTCKPADANESHEEEQPISMKKHDRW